MLEIIKIRSKSIERRPGHCYSHAPFIHPESQLAMSFEDVAKQLDPEIYLRFKKALELGKWPDGRVLSKEQKEICLQAVMLFEAAQEKTESERVGFIDREKKTSPCGSDKSGSLEEDLSPVRILH